VATLVIKPTNEALYLTEEVTLPWTATNLREGSFRLRTHEQVYWRVEMTGYDAATGKLNVRIVEYEVAPDEYLPHRKAKREVRNVHFAPLDREQFCGQLSYFRISELPIRVTPGGTEPNEETPIRMDDHSGSQPEVDSPVVASRSRTFPLRFRMPLIDLRFRDGYAEGRHEHLFGVSPFRIPNPHLITEFHPIRGYFAKRLGRKTVEVSATLAFDPAGEPVIRRASAPQIARIDAQMIAALRTSSLRRLTRAGQVDKQLFTPEDLMANYGEDEPVRALLPPGGMDLLQEILGSQDVRNARHLSYLADKQERGQTLRFVLSPRFGFLFFIRGEGMHHFVLELLNSHATYVWSLPGEGTSVASQLELIAAEVAHLNAAGRVSYRRTTTFQTFWLIQHDAIGSDLVDGFPRWKHRLEEGLV
jgi:hypothetical protein